MRIISFLQQLVPLIRLSDVFEFEHAETKSVNDTSKDQPTVTVISSTTTSNAESNSSTS